MVVSTVEVAAKEALRGSGVGDKLDVEMAVAQW